MYLQPGLRNRIFTPNPMFPNLVTSPSLSSRDTTLLSGFWRIVIPLLFKKKNCVSTYLCIPNFSFIFNLLQMDLYVFF